MADIMMKRKKGAPRLSDTFSKQLHVVTSSKSDSLKRVSVVV